MFLISNCACFLFLTGVLDTVPIYVPQGLPLWSTLAKVGQYLGLTNYP